MLKDAVQLTKFVVSHVIMFQSQKDVNETACEQRYLTLHLPQESHSMSIAKKTLRKEHISKIVNICTVNTLHFT